MGEQTLTHNAHTSRQNVVTHRVTTLIILFFTSFSRLSGLWEREDAAAGEKNSGHAAHRPGEYGQQQRQRWWW